MPTNRAELLRGRLQATLEKLDRIIVGRRDLQVIWSSIQDEFVAYNLKGNVYLSQKFFPNLDDIDTVVAVLGANYHEVAHLLFSPHETSPFILEMGGSQDLKRAYNYLEDARIEALFVARYATAKKYFLSTFLDVMLKADDDSGFFVISHGRRFIPRDVRLELEETFQRAHSVTDEDMEEFKRIIDAYRRLNNKKFGRYGTASKLVKEFSRLLKKYDPDVSSSCGDGANKSSQESDNDAVFEAQFVARDTDEQDEKEEEEEKQQQEGDGNSDSSDDEGEDSDEKGDGSGDGDSQDEGEEGDQDSDGNGGDGQGDSDEDSDPDNDGQESDGVGGKGTKKRSLKQRAIQVKKELLEDEQVQDQVSQIKEAMNSSTINVEELSKSSYLREVPVTSELKFISQRVKAELDKLYADLEGSWLYGSDTGLVNISRAMTPESDPDEIYDEWDAGTQTEVGVEMVILLDTSASMSGDKIEAAEDSMWVLKRAIDEIPDSVVSVISFDERTGLIYGASDQAKHDKKISIGGLGGDTRPAEGMQIARRRLENSKLPNKIFVIITDGQWSTYVQPHIKNVESVTTSLLHMPGDSVYIGIGEACRASYEKFFKVNQVITDPMEIINVVRNMVTQILRDAKH